MSVWNLFVLYGLCDAGDNGDVTIKSHLTNELGWKTISGEKSFFVNSTECISSRCTGLYVDNCIHAGVVDFEKITEKSLALFQSKPRIIDDFNFFGILVKSISARSFHIGQPNYTQNLARILEDCTFENFRKHRALSHG